MNTEIAYVLASGILTLCVTLLITLIKKLLAKYQIEYFGIEFSQLGFAILTVCLFSIVIGTFLTTYLVHRWIL